MLIIKNTVSLKGLQPPTIVGIMAVSSAFHHFGFDCIITSGTDGKHSVASLHYVGFAVDFRVKHLPSSADIQAVYKLAKSALTAEFDLVLEFADGAPSHIHLEFQPK